MHQIVQEQGDNRLVALIKFANLPDASDGSRYEVMGIDQHWIHSLEDASGHDTYYGTDTRSWPRHMQIGESHAFVTSHELVRKDRGTCKINRRHGFHRKMWLVGIFDDCYWGPDLGNQPTAVLAYDSTGGSYAADRGVELYYFAWGMGWVRWESYRSDLVYEHGAAAFPDEARGNFEIQDGVVKKVGDGRSDFYLLGGPTPPFGPTGCVELVVPSYPPPGEPLPLPPSRFPLARPYSGVHMNYLKINGKYVGVDPRKNTVVYADRDVGGAWEEIEYAKVDDHFLITFKEANVALCLTPDGRLETRPAGTAGGWERFFATTQPDGANLLYRKDDAGNLIQPVLTIEVG